jgi:hypothetical protein
MLAVLDTGALARDVVHSSRGPRLTSLLMALDRRGARAFITPQIAEEVERHLSDIATGTDNLDLVFRRWRQMYLPRLVIVDVPPSWGQGDPRVQAILRRHPADAPLAQLATTLGPCWLLAEDHDLVDTVGATEKWILLSHAFANNSAYEENMTTAIMSGLVVAELGSAVIGGARRLPWLAQLGLLFVGGVSLYEAHRRGHIASAVSGVKSLAGAAADAYGPSLMVFSEWLRTGQMVRDEHEVPPLSTPSLDQRIARVLAVADDPMTAPEVARALDYPGSLATRTADVRDLVALHPRTFVETTRWRYQLGDGPYRPALLNDDEVAVYHSHRRQHLGLPDIGSERHRGSSRRG